MNSLLTIIPVAAGAYIATNLDNFVLLVSLLARYRNNRINVVAGFLTCMLILGVIGFWISEAARFLPLEYLGLLGLVPLSIGAIGIMRLVRRTTGPVTTGEDSVDGERTVFIATLISQLGNGTDTIITFGALFADSMPATDTLIIFTLAAMSVFSVLAAMYGLKHPALGDWVERNAHRITPFILVFVGVYILMNTVTDLVPD